MWFLGLLQSTVLRFVLIGAVSLGLLVGAYIKGRTDATVAVAVSSAKVYKRGVETRSKVEKEVKRLPDTDLDKRLEKWMRD